MKTKKPEEIKMEDLKAWRDGIHNNEKERERLTKIAMKHQEEIKQNFLTTKLKSTKLTVFFVNFCLGRHFFPGFLIYISFFWGHHIVFFFVFFFFLVGGGGGGRGGRRGGTPPPHFSFRNLLIRYIMTEK